MKLYYSAGSCSTSCHIVLEESGLKYEAVELDFDKEADAAQVAKLNPLGTLPILLTDEGKQLDQNIAIHAYVAGKAPGKRLLPEAGTLEYAQAVNWMSFVAADLHKSVGALFGVNHMSQDKKVQEPVREFLRGRALENIKYVDDKLAGRDYLMGSTFTAPDAYAFVVLSWTKYLEIPLTPYKNIQAYLARVAARPAVKKVLEVEKLLD